MTRLWLAAALCAVPQTGAAECRVLGDLGLVLDVDPGVVVEELPGVVDLDFAPGARALHFISLWRAGAPRVIGIWREPGVGPAGAEEGISATLPSGIVIRYETLIVEPSGSGGAEAMLMGWIGTDPPLRLNCLSQAEMMPDPAWCLAHLESLAPVADGCAVEGP